MVTSAPALALASATPTLSHAALPAPQRDLRVRLGGEQIAIDILPWAGKAEAERPLILYCGGADFTRSRDGGRVAKTLRTFGDVILWDYPGRGGSTGFPDPITAERVVRGLARWVERQSRDRTLIVWGHSLGGFVGSQMVRHVNADAIVLETTAADARAAIEATGIPIPDMFKRLLPLLDRYNIPAALEGFDGDVLILGAGRDRVLPVELSRQLASSLPNSTYMEAPQASHFNMASDERTARAVMALRRKLQGEI